MKQYKIVPGPTTLIDVAKGTSDQACKSFESIINSNAQAGWTYHSMEMITTKQTKGCLAKQEIVTEYYMLIFEKDV